MNGQSEISRSTLSVVNSIPESSCCVGLVGGQRQCKEIPQSREDEFDLGSRDSPEPLSRPRGRCGILCLPPYDQIIDKRQLKGKKGPFGL